jgi:SNF2 family DNA or RNA helicase
MNDEDIKREIAKLTMMLEENERKRKLEAEVVECKNLKINGNDAVFTFFPRRDDFLIHLADLGVNVSPWQNDASCDVEYFRSVVHEKLTAITNVKLNFSQEILDKIAKWKPAPHVYCDYNKEHTHVVFDLGPKAETRPLYKLNIHRGYNKYVLNVSNLIELQKILGEYTNRYPKQIVVLSDEVRDDLAREIDNRSKIDKIVAGDGTDLEPIILGGITLRPFQVQSVEFLKYNDGNGIIALDMGLGKTPVALAYTKWYWDNIDATQRFLIIGPASLRPNWTAEIKKYLNIAVYQITGTTPAPLDVQHLLKKTDYKLFYVNYDVLARGMKTIDPVTKLERTTYPWPAIMSMAGLRMVMDEAHYIKNPAASRTQAIHQIKFKSSCLLTGTPMKNGPGELYTLVRQIKPDFAGSNQSWLDTYTYNNGRMARDPETLREVLKPIMFRRRKSEVVKDLPPVNRINITYELGEVAKKLYNQVLLGFYDDLAKWDGTTNNSQEIQNLLTSIMRMKQVCSADKVDFVADRAMETYDADEGEHRKVLIFSQFANEPPIVSRIHKLLGQEAVMFTGNDDVFDRQKIVDQFQNDPDIHFLVCSTKAASEGLNITEAGHVIFVDLMWTPSDHSQAEGRAYGRISDSHSITSTYVIAEGTIEEHITRILMRKFDQISRVIDGNETMSGESIAKELFGELKNMRMLK